MKEKIFKILHNRDRMPGERFGDIEGKIENLVNQEVERRIAERMPSEMTLEEAEIAAKGTDYACFAVEPEGNDINFADAAAFYLEGWNACRSRLSQKTEGGGESKSSKPFCPNCQSSAFVGFTGFHTWCCDKCGSEWEGGGE